MDPSIDSIKASDGSAPASLAIVQNVRAPLAATIIVNTVSGINTNFHGSMGTPHTFTDPITSETLTVISEATTVDFRGHVDGTDLVIDEIAPGFTDLGSEVGDVIIIKPTTQVQDQVAEILEVVHNDDGTLKDNTVDADVIVAGAVGPTELSTTAIYLDDGAQPSSQGSLSTSEVAITGMAVTFTVPAGGRKVEIIAKGDIQNTATQTTIMRMRETNTSGATVDSSSVFIAAATATESYFLMAILDLAAGSHTYIVSTQQASGTGTASVGKMIAKLI